MRYILATLMMLATPLAAFDINAMTPDERSEFRAEIRSYLLENPEVLMEAMAVLQKRNEAEAAIGDAELLSRYSDDLYNDGISHVAGNPDGDVTIVEFLDYRCGYCRRAHKDVGEVMAKDGNIRLIIKEYPILGDDSTKSSQLAIAALQEFGPEAYEKVHDALIAFSGPINNATIKKIAGDAGLDAGTLIANMDTANVQNHISKTRVLGQEMQVSGTPTFVIGDQLVRGYVTADVMAKIIADYRTRAN